MDQEKQPDVVARSKPEFRLGQEAVEAATAASKKPTQRRTPSTKQSASALPWAINKPLMQCYPEIADDEDEQLLADVRHHWLGRLAIFLVGALLILMLLGFAYALPSLVNGIGYSANVQFKTIAGLTLVIVGILMGLGTFSTLWIYRQSHLLITNENIIEVRQISLFSKKVSHLNMINVEDVTVTKRGIIQTAFNFGTITIETAGEKENFSFPYTPNPDIYRRLVINAHEDAIDRIGHLGSGLRVEVADNNF